MPPLTATVDQWSGGSSDDGDGTVPTPRGTTQVVTRGKLIVIITVWQWRLRGTVAARDPRQSLGSSRMVTCHLAIGGSRL
ncbi:hypothetical protein Tco_0082729 [Tanacetum coccineum]